MTQVKPNLMPIEKPSLKAMPGRIFRASMAHMKEALNLAALGLKKNSDEFRYFRERLFEVTYAELGQLFRELSDMGLVEPCPCGHKMKDGWSDCPDCGGSSWRVRTQ